MIIAPFRGRRCITGGGLMAAGLGRTTNATDRHERD
jgi:hypothetical protein